MVIYFSSEQFEQPEIGEKTVNEEECISSANNNMENESSPLNDSVSGSKSVGNNNWWGSWIHSAKSKVNIII